MRRVAHHGKLTPKEGRTRGGAQLVLGGFARRVEPCEYLPGALASRVDTLELLEGRWLVEMQKRHDDLGNGVIIDRGVETGAVAPDPTCVVPDVNPRSRRGCVRDREGRADAPRRHAPGRNEGAP